MRTCYLHIGAPKSGSTSIQGFLGDYRGALAKRGLDVADFGQDDVVTGALALSGGLPSERNPATPKTAAWRWLDEHIAKTDADLCVSREGICNHLSEPAPVEFLKSFFASRGMKLKLIAYVRDHVGYMNAAYAQQAKKLRAVHTFDNWLIAALNSGRYAYWRRFRRLIEDPEVELSLSSLHQLPAGGLIPHFCGEIGRGDIDAGGFDETPHRNASPGPKAIVAGVLVGRGLKERGIDPDFDQSLHRRFRLAVEARGWNEKPFFGPDEATCSRILENFSGGDERLAQAVWGMPWAEAAPPTVRAQNAFDLRTATREEARDVEDLAREVLATAQARKPTPAWKRLFERA